MPYTYRKTEHGDIESCALCNCEAPLDEFEVRDIPTKYRLKQANESTQQLLCEVCACTYCGTVLGSSAFSYDEDRIAARMLATTANLLLDKLTSRRANIRIDTAVEEKAS